MIWKVIEICILLVVSLFTSSIIIRVLEKKQATERTWRKPLLGILLLAGLLSYFNEVATGAIAFFFFLTLLASAYIAGKKEDKRLLIKLGKLAGASATFAIIANFLRELQFGFRSENLYWLIAPVVFYLILGILDRKYAAAKPKKVNLDFILPLTATVVLTVIAVLVFNYSKGVIK